MYTELNVDVDSAVQRTLPQEFCNDFESASSMLKKFAYDMAYVIETNSAYKQKYPTLSGYVNLILPDAPTNVDNVTYKFWKKHEVLDHFSRYSSTNASYDDIENILSDFFRINVLRQELIDCSKQNGFHENWLTSDIEWENFAGQLVKSLVNKRIAIKPQSNLSIDGFEFKLNDLALIVLNQPTDPKNLQGERTRDIRIRCTVQTKKGNNNMIVRFNKKCFFSQLTNKNSDQYLN